MRLVKASEMRELDRRTIQELGIPGAVLMENAARGASRIFLEHFGPDSKSHVVILCGQGNNGGDGYVMARYLYQADLQVSVVVLAPFGKIKGDALLNLEIIKRMNIDIIEAPDLENWSEVLSMLAACDFVIDGILGTGINSDVRGFYSQVISDINSADKPLMAIDTPSGLNSDTGQVMGVSIDADLTATFGFPKLGQTLFPGADLVGRLVRVDICIPDCVSNEIESRYNLIEPNDFRNMFHIEKRDIHKGDKGHLFVLAGSRGKTGAAVLTALGALRSGAGLVTVGIPESLNSVVEGKLTEAMTLPLPETRDGTLSLDAEKEIVQFMAGKSALAIGPGLSTNEETSALIRTLIAQCDIPVVVDADGLNALAGNLDVLTESRCTRVLTPHPGEMGRLTGLANSDIQFGRVVYAERFSIEYGCYLVLKGAGTIVAEPDGQISVNPTGNPALSSGGSGDVLTGMIAGFMARGWPAVKAAQAGVYMHGLAADFLAETMGDTGILANELLSVLPFLSASLARGEWPLEGLPLYMDFCQSL